MLCERTPSQAASPWYWLVLRALGISCLHGLCGFHLSILVGTLPRQPGHRRSFVQSAHFPGALHAPKAARFAAETETSKIFEATPAVGVLGTRKHGGSIPGFVLGICLASTFWCLPCGQVVQRSRCLEKSILVFNFDSFQSLQLEQCRCSYFVLRSCGYSLAKYTLIAIVLAILFQNVGGALHIFCSSTWPRSKKCLYAMMSLAMAPPFKLIDPNLEATRIYMLLARLLSEDLPQLLLQAHFTITVYQNWFVMVNLGVSLLFALMDAKDVYNYCISQDQQHPYVEMAAGGNWK